MLTATVVAQQPAVPPAAGDQPAFRTGADLVIVDAVVVDKAGRPITDLKATDFEVKDEGRAQSVSLFQTVSVAADAPAASTTAASRYAYSTNAGVGTAPGRAFVLFFDDVHLTQADGDRAKVALSQFLDRELQPGVRARVFGDRLVTAIGEAGCVVDGGDRNGEGLRRGRVDAAERATRCPAGERSPSRLPLALAAGV